MDTPCFWLFCSSAWVARSTYFICWMKWSIVHALFGGFGLKMYSPIHSNIVPLAKAAVKPQTSLELRKVFHLLWPSHDFLMSNVFCLGSLILNRPSRWAGRRRVWDVKYRSWERDWKLTVTLFPHRLQILNLFVCMFLLWKYIRQVFNYSERVATQETETAATREAKEFTCEVTRSGAQTFERDEVCSHDTVHKHNTHRHNPGG